MLVILILHKIFYLILRVSRIYVVRIKTIITVSFSLKLYLNYEFDSADLVRLT